MQFNNIDDNVSFQLILSGLGISVIPEAVINLYRDKNITHLDLSYNSLKSIEGISYFKHLESLVLDNNKIPMIGGGADEFSRPIRIVISKLKVLSINNNRIANLDGFLRNISTCFPNLTYLSMLRNPCCPDDLDLSSRWNILGQWIGGVEYKRFQAKCTSALPSLEFLDSRNLRKARPPSQPVLPFDFPKGQQILGNFIKFKNGIVEVFTEEERDMSPLPSNCRSPGEHHGTYLRNRMEYIGKESEGNRFIGNSQL